MKASKLFSEKIFFKQFNEIDRTVEKVKRRQYIEDADYAVNYEQQNPHLLFR